MEVQKTANGVKALMQLHRSRLTILEWAPAADALYSIACDPLRGYAGVEGHFIQIGQGVKLRPTIEAYYAGGKATNVARILDRLLELPADAGLWDEAEGRFRVELVTLLPDTPAGRFIADLQRTEMQRVQLRFAPAPGEARLCVNLADPSTRGSPGGLVEFNLSPFVVWETGTEALLEAVVEELATDWLILAGKPPLGPGLSDHLTARLVRRVKGRQPGTFVSLDLGGRSADDEGSRQLSHCLAGEEQPDAILINQEEYAAVEPALWARYAGILIVHDAGGCWLRRGPGASVFDWKATPRDVPALAPEAYATIGAGDAVHAGFALGWLRTGDLWQAVRYSQAVAAAVVSHPRATTGLTPERVRAFLERGDENFDHRGGRGVGPGPGA